MKADTVELIKDLQSALSKSLNNQVIREYEHLQVRCEEAIEALETQPEGSGSKKSAENNTNHSLMCEEIKIKKMTDKKLSDESKRLSEEIDYNNDRIGHIETEMFYRKNPKLRQLSK